MGIGRRKRVRWSDISPRPPLDPSEQLTSAEVARVQALAALSGNGLVTQVGQGYALRQLVVDGDGFAITNPNGAGGNPTLALKDDLKAIEDLIGNGIAVRLEANRWALRTLKQPAAGITITDPDGVVGDPTFALANDLAAVEALATTGWARRTGTDSWQAREINASDVLVDRIAGSTYSQLQQFINTMHSPGLISGGEITNPSGTDVTVAAGTGMIRILDDDVSSMPFFDWAADTFTLPADDAIRYFGVVYNGGAPVLEMRTVFDWDKDTEIPIGAAVALSTGGVLTAYNPFKTGDPITNIIQRFDSIAPVQRDNFVGGLILGETGTRNITMSGGRIWTRLNDLDVAAFDSSGSDTFFTAYFDGADWVITTGVTQWPNTQYNDIATGLVAMTNNFYSNLWFSIGANGTFIGMVYGTQQYPLLANAVLEAAPSFVPPGTLEFTVLLGRLTFQKNGGTAELILSAFSNPFDLTPINTHNDLGGLQGGTTAEFFHLTSAAYNNLSAGLTATPQFARLGLGVAADGTRLLTHADTVLMRTTVGFTDGAGAGAGTLTNAPAAGNPTKWIPVDDNGTTRYIPSW